MRRPISAWAIQVHQEPDHRRSRTANLDLIAGPSSSCCMHHSPLSLVKYGLNKPWIMSVTGQKIIKYATACNSPMFKSSVAVSTTRSAQPRVRHPLSSHLFFASPDQMRISFARSCAARNTRTRQYATHPRVQLSASGACTYAAAQSRLVHEESPLLRPQHHAGCAHGRKSQPLFF